MTGVNLTSEPQTDDNGQWNPNGSAASATGAKGLGQLEQVADATLVRQAQSGDHEALDLLLRRHRQSLLNHARQHCGNCILVEDLCQETCLRLTSHLSDLREPEGFGWWMHTFLANAVRNCRRKNCKKICTPLQEDDLYQMESLSVEAACGADADWQCLLNLLWQQASVKDWRCGRVAALMLERYAQNERLPSVRTIARAMRISNPTAQGCRRATLLNWRHALRAVGFYP